MPAEEDGGASDGGAGGTTDDPGALLHGAAAAGCCCLLGPIPMSLRHALKDLLYMALLAQSSDADAGGGGGSAALEALATYRGLPPPPTGKRRGRGNWEQGWGASRRTFCCEPTQFAPV